MPGNRQSIKERKLRPILVNPDGSISTEYTITSMDPRLNQGLPTVIPTIFDAQRHTAQAAIEHALAGGEHFGVFPTLAASERNIKRTHGKLERHFDRLLPGIFQEIFGTPPSMTTQLIAELLGMGQKK